MSRQSRDCCRAVLSVPVFFFAIVKHLGHEALPLANTVAEVKRDEHEVSIDVDVTPPSAPNKASELAHGCR